MSFYTGARRLLRHRLLRPRLPDLPAGPPARERRRGRRALRCRRCRRWSWPGGSAGPPGSTCPRRTRARVPTRQWLYYLWKDNAHQGQNWCKYGKANGSYVQQIEWDDCRSGNVWTAGQSVIAAIGQGYVSVTPLQLARAYAALANGGTLYSPRIGEALIGPRGKVVRRITPPVAGHLPVAKSHAGLHQARAGRRGHQRHGRGHVRRVPARQGLRGGQDRYRAGQRQPVDLGVRLVRAVRPPQVRRGDDDPELRFRRRGLRARGPADLGRRSTAWRATRRRCPAATCPACRTWTGPASWSRRAGLRGTGRPARLARKPGRAASRRRRHR